MPKAKRPQRAKEDSYLMETEDGMLVSVPESRLDAWNAAREQEPPQKSVQQLREELLSEIYSSSR